MQSPAGINQDDRPFSTLTTSIISSALSSFSQSPTATHGNYVWEPQIKHPSFKITFSDNGSTGRGILIGILSAFGSAGVAVLVLAIFFFFKYTSHGRILLDRMGRPGEYDDEQAFAREEAEALETMDEMQKVEYLRAKGM